MIIKGDVVVKKGFDYSDVTEITGSLYCSGADTSAAFPRNPKYIDPDCTAKSKSHSLLMESFMSVGILFADGISSKIISKKTRDDVIIYSVIIVGKTKKSIVVERNEAFSHGESLSDAMDSLIYKISDRDTSKFSEWTLNTSVSLADAIASYRAITGACEFGTKSFCKSIHLKDFYTVKEIIDITKGAFGADTYAAFFKAN